MSSGFGPCRVCGHYYCKVHYNMNPLYGTNAFGAHGGIGANVVDCNCKGHIEKKLGVSKKYEELQLAFKAIHDEYTSSDSFKQWVAAKEAWEETDAYKAEPEKYLGNIISGQLVSWDGLVVKPPHEEYDLYRKFCYLSRYLNGSYDGNYNLKCPGHSKPQEKFDLKRKLLLIEYGLPSDTKLPSEWYWYGYEWEWD